MSEKKLTINIPEPPLSVFLFSDVRMAWLWFFVRVYVGYEWLIAGWAKVINPLWVGPQAGVAVSGFLHGALLKTAGPHPDVTGFYAVFINNVAIPNAAFFSYMVAFGEVLVGIGLILGIFTGISAFFGAFMNMNYLFAGTVSANPVLFVGQLFLILAWRTAGWLGVDKYLLPLLGTPWQKGKVFKK